MREKNTTTAGARTQLLEAHGTTLRINDLLGKYPSEDFEILGHGGSSLIGAEKLVRLLAASHTMYEAIKETLDMEQPELPPRIVKLLSNALNLADGGN